MNSDEQMDVVMGDRLPNWQPIPHGGFKTLFLLGIIGSIVYATIHAIEWVQLPRSEVPGQVALGALWLIIVVLMIAGGSESAVAWIREYIDLNVKGRRLAFLRCGTHGYRHLILISSKGELNWVTNQHKHVNQSQDCVWHGCVLPLGGWTRKPHLHVGHPHNVAFEITNPYQSERFWHLGANIQLHLNHTTATVSLEDSEGSRLVGDVWFLLRLIYEDRYRQGEERAFHLPRVNDVVSSLMRERDQARQSANELFDELTRAEEKVHATKRFVKSKQALEIRVWLLDVLYTWTLKLHGQRIRFTSSIDGQSLLDRTRSASKQLEKIETDLHRTAEIRQQTL